jgi:glutaminyl-tRNA synthetase
LIEALAVADASVTRTDSLKVLENCKLEKFLANTKPLDKYQFERLGYFSTDYDTKENRLVFNRACTLKDSWNK